MRNILKASHGISKDDIMDALGIERAGLTGTLSVAGTFVTGLAVGALFGVLFAPKAGRELRHDIERKASELGERASEYGERSAYGGSRGGYGRGERFGGSERGAGDVRAAGEVGPSSGGQSGIGGPDIGQSQSS